VIVKQLFTENDYRNFNYLVGCPETGDALAIDPLDSARCLAAAKAEGWTISQILNTHEHSDHTGGNLVMIESTGAVLLAHENAKDKIQGINQGLKAGDVIRVGKTVELEVLNTPGHTMCHVCLLSHTDQPALFCGDTLFNAGAGNCHGGGHPKELFKTFDDQLSKLKPDTLVYPGHDYLENNLGFTLDREPENVDAKKLLNEVNGQDPHHPKVTTLGLEKKINTFFRLTNPSVIKHLREKFSDLPDNPSEEDVFIKLRELRNSW
jgi:hydroxyacylglutathione hydrolase